MKYSWTRHFSTPEACREISRWTRLFFSAYHREYECPAIAPRRGGEDCSHPSGVRMLMTYPFRGVRKGRVPRLNFSHRSAVQSAPLLNTPITAKMPNYIFEEVIHGNTFV